MVRVMEGIYSLFVDGLPWEMTWGWLKEIFRREGEVFDVYVSKKTRQFNSSKFGFVRYKKLEEARRAVRNMDGAMIKGRKLKVFFAKYDKYRGRRNDSAMAENTKVTESDGDEEKHGAKIRDGISFKDVVEGHPENAKTDGWQKEKTYTILNHGAKEHNRQSDLVKLKGVVWNVVEEIFNSNKLEEIKCFFVTFLEEAAHVVESKHLGSREKAEKERQRKEGEAEQGRAFLEEELLDSMMLSRNDTYRSSIGAFESSLSEFQGGTDVGLIDVSGREAEKQFGPLVMASSQPVFCLGGKQLGPEKNISNGPNCSPCLEIWLGAEGLSNKAHNQMEMKDFLANEFCIQIGEDNVQSFEGDQGNSQEAIEKVPETQPCEIDSTGLGGSIEIVLATEEDQTESQNPIGGRSLNHEGRNEDRFEGQISVEIVGEKAAESDGEEKEDSEAEVDNIWSVGRTLGLEVEVEEELPLVKALLRMDRRKKKRMEGLKQKRKEGNNKQRKN